MLFIIRLVKTLLALFLTALSLVFAIAVWAGVDFTYPLDLYEVATQTLLSLFILCAVCACVFYLLQRLQLAWVALMVAILSFGLTLYYADQVISLKKGDAAKLFQSPGAFFSQFIGGEKSE